MFDDTMFLLLIMPLLLIQISLAIYVILSIQKNGVRSLSKTAWLWIGLVGGTIGSILFIMYGKVRDYHD